MEIKDKMLNESESGKMSKQRRFTEQLLEKQMVEKSSNIISPQKEIHRTAKYLVVYLFGTPQEVPGEQERTKCK